MKNLYFCWVSPNLPTVKAKKQTGGKPFDLGDTPKALIEAGLKNNPLSIGTRAITKAQNNINPDHNIDTPTLMRVLEKLHNPIALIEQPLNDNEDKNKRRVSVILDLQDSKEKYIVVGIEEDKHIDGKNVVNDIRTIHSRKDYSEMYKKFLEYQKTDKLFKVFNPKIKGLIAAELADYTSVGGRSLNDIINQDFKNFKGGTEKRFQDSEDSDDIFNEIANGSDSSDDILNDVHFEKSLFLLGFTQPTTTCFRFVWVLLTLANLFGFFFG